MKLPLKELRERKGITQLELSRVLEVSPSTVGMWEQGRREPDYKSLKILANYFNVSVDYLLDNETNPVSLSQDETKLLKSYRAFDKATRTLVMSLVERISDNVSESFTYSKTV